MNRHIKPNFNYCSCFLISDSVRRKLSALMNRTPDKHTPFSADLSAEYLRISGFARPTAPAILSRNFASLEGKQYTACTLQLGFSLKNPWSYLQLFARPNEYCSKQLPWLSWMQTFNLTLKAVAISVNAVRLVVANGVVMHWQGWRSVLRFQVTFCREDQAANNAFSGAKWREKVWRFLVAKWVMDFSRKWCMRMYALFMKEASRGIRSREVLKGTVLATTQYWFEVCTRLIPFIFIFCTRNKFITL